MYICLCVQVVGFSIKYAISELSSSDLHLFGLLKESGIIVHKVCTPYTIPTIPPYLTETARAMPHLHL